MAADELLLADGAAWPRRPCLSGQVVSGLTAFFGASQSTCYVLLD